MDDHCNCDEVNGAVVNVRGKGDKLAVWVTDSGNTEAVVSPVISPQSERSELGAFYFCPGVLSGYCCMCVSGYCCVPKRRKFGCWGDTFRR